MKDVLTMVAVLVVSTGVGVAFADPEHPEQPGGNNADPSGMSCKTGKVKRRYKVMSHSQADTTPKKNERYRIDVYGDGVWVLSASSHDKKSPPDFYARGKVYFDEGCNIKSIEGQAFIDGHAGHTLVLTPSANWKELRGEIETRGTHPHEEPQPGARDCSFNPCHRTHNGQVHWKD